MLVITRRVGESIVIGESIVVRFVDRNGKRIKVGIEAPHEVSIRRGELEVHGVAGESARPAYAEVATTR